MAGEMLTEGPSLWPAAVQTGGVVVFALAIWYEQRDIKRAIREIRDAVVAMVAREGRSKRHRTATPLGVPNRDDEER